MRDKTILKKMTASALFVVMGAVCGILEGMLPLQLVIPIPGVKLGIANIFVVFAFKFLGASFAFGINIARVLVVFLFSGNVISMLLSLSGAFFSFISLIFMMKFYGKVFSFVGVSAVSAVFHGAGQLIFAIFFVGQAVFYYIPIMLSFCAITGIFTGTLMNVSVNKVSRLFFKV